MARRILRGALFTCDSCGKVEESFNVRNLMPKGWVRLTRRFTMEGSYVETSIHQDLCQECADRIDAALGD